MTIKPCPVLLYHEVDETSNARMPAYNVTPQTFRSQLEQLLELDFELVTVTEMVSRLRRSDRTERLAAVTFDDGFRSFLDHAMHVLTDLDVPATMYIPTRWTGAAPGWLIGGDGPTIMSDEEVTALADTAIEIGGHTHSHLHLDLLRPEQMRSEIAQNRVELEALTGYQIASFAYPHGSHDHRVRQIVRECGYDNACAVNGAPITAGGDVFRIGRIVADEHTDMSRVSRYQNELQRQYPDGRTAFRTAAARHAYRATRRLRLHRHHQSLLSTR